MDDYMLTRDILYRIGKAYISNLSGEIRTETGHLIIAIQDIDLLRRTSPDAADDYMELLDGCKQRVKHAMVDLDDLQLREHLASVIHGWWIQWTKDADIHNDVDREFLFRDYHDLQAIDKLAPLRDADSILDIVRMPRSEGDIDEI